MDHMYNVGDKVVIEKCTDQIKSMLSMVGQTATITEKTFGFWDKEYPAYYLKEDKKHWYWREDWLIPAVEMNISENDIDDIWEEI